MADFTDQDKELLDKLRKGFQSNAKTRSELDPWQELLSRDATVNANRAVAAAKIIEGFAGSWAAQYKYGRGSSINPTGNLVGEPVAGFDPQGPPVPIRSKVNKLGRRGMPEINFVPYNWRTNTFGSKGPSLVGHPISYEVVGPTLKSPFLDWTWQVSLGAGVGGGDKLIMDVRPDGNPNVMQPYVGNIINAYGPAIGSNWTIGDNAEPNGGLYVLITDYGLNGGSLPAGRAPLTPLDLYTDTATFELFRIASIPPIAAGSPYEIDLHPDKRLEEYFDVSGAPNISIRAITILAPFVTRLQAVPQSGAAGGNDGTSTSGREQTFVVISPERAATNDNFPPYQGTSPGDGTWLQGGFTFSRGSPLPLPGAPAAYGGKVRLPVPNPVREETGAVESVLLSPSAAQVGQWIIDVPNNALYTSGIFSSELPIINVTTTVRDDDLPFLTGAGTIENCLGWFDVVDTIGATQILLNRVPETSPVTGLTYWGPGPFQVNTFGTRLVNLFYNLHQPISSLWQNEFNLDNVESSRLKTLIDPQWVGRFEKQISDPLLIGAQPAPPPGSGPGRPDRAIFNTRSLDTGGVLLSAENPGNLMDLGFRMVLFPGKPNPNNLTEVIPDFDRPITGREVVIDGSIPEKQYIEIDYSSGVVRLSHPPPTSRANVPDAPSDIIPNGISGSANNPRGEVVLFASCVPYSMEDSQVGTGNRVTVSKGADQRDFDLYSDEISAHIDQINTTFIPTNPYIGISGITGAADIVLDRLLPDAPETGVFTITRGADNSPFLGLWGYTEKKTVTAGPLQVTALGGVSALLLSGNPDPLATGEERLVVIRREANFYRQSFSIPFLVDQVSGDTYYGSSARGETLRFERARAFPQLDGSVSIRPLPDLAANLDRATGSIVPSRRSLPTETSINAPVYTRQYFSESGIYEGLFYQIDPSSAAVLGGSINAGMRYNAASGGFDGASNRGPSLEMSTPGNTPPLWHGIITSGSSSPPGSNGQGMFTMMSNFRFVAKVGTLARNPAAQSTGFVGLIQDESGPGITPIIPTLSDPALAIPVHRYLGFQFDTTAAQVWRFWTRGPAGDLIISTAASTSVAATSIEGPYYLVIEVNRLPNTSAQFSRVVKLGVYDGDKTLLSSTTVTNTGFLPFVSGRGFFTAAAIRENLVSPGGVNMFIFSMKVVLDTDIDDLPPLP